MEKITPKKIFSLKGKRKITAITAYDYSSAYYAEKAGVDIILVGDSLGMVIKGEESTLNVTLDEVEYHTRIVARTVSTPLVVGDLPFLSYFRIEDAVKSAGRLGRAGAGAVKLEGSRPQHIKAIVEEGIPVMGHIGLTPQQYLRMGYRTQGKKALSAIRLLEEAKQIEDAGAFSIVLESIPMEVSKEITDVISIPTIGIGAGPYCDGQILVFHDLLGIYPGRRPSFVREYANIGEVMEKSIKQYAEDVISGEFPTREESFVMEDDEREKFYMEVRKWKLSRK